MSRPAARRAAVAGAWAALAALAIPAGAAGAGRTYEVVQCDPLNRGVSGMTLGDAPAYAVRQLCGHPDEDHAIKITNSRFARHGRSGRARWSVDSPSLRLVGVELQAKLRRDRGHVSRLFAADADGHEVAKVAAGGSGPAGFRTYAWHSPSARAQQFVARLRCERSDGCPRSDAAKTWLRNVHLTVADDADPRFQRVVGTLVRPGWIRRDQSLYAAAADGGSGLQRLVIMANGTPFAGRPGGCVRISATTATSQFQPCTPQLSLQTDATTTTPPFHDGRNEVAVCAIDFAANRSCAERTVHVDNTPPTLSFASFQDPDDPELISATVADTASGVAGGRIYYRPAGSADWRPVTTDHVVGRLQARIDSTIDPPGEYEFMATATDVAGNTAITTRRADGRQMILTFPLKSGVDLDARLAGGSSRLTVGYRQTSKVAGILRDVSGEPLADQDVTVTEYFGEGALIDRRVRTVHTDSNGRWRERLPGGPSRTVSASYAGTRRYLPDDDRAGTLWVKTKATFRLSRRRVDEGHRVAFKGRVRHLAARIPTGGKLVELEVKDGKRWHTVRRPFYTRPNGKYKLHYRFGRFYTRNVRYRFRVRVLRERGWPYKAPVSSRVRKLLVKAR